MMCSTWKISIFGILALMLAFGMTTDALAVNGEVTVAVTGADALRATGTNNITFTVTVGTAPTDGQAKTGKVTITIPAGWSRPVYISGDVATGDPPTADGVIDESDLNDDGEVLITSTGTDTETTDDDAIGTISGRTLVATFGKTATSAVTFVYRSKHPRLANTYAFALGTQYHDITDVADDDIMKRGGRFYLDIKVGPVDSGVGTFSVTGLSGVYKHADVDPKSEKGKYFLASKQSIAGLNFAFKADGTMIKDSTFSIDAGTDGWGGFYPGPAGSSAGKVTVSGTGVELDEANSTVTKVTVKITAARIEYGHTTNIRIAGLEAPEVKEETSFSTRTFTPATASKADADDSPTETTKGEFTFITTAAPGTGKVALTTEQVTGDPDTREVSSPDTLTYATAEEALGSLVFTFTELQGVYGVGTGKIEIEIPAGFTPEPLKAFGAATSAGTVGIADFRGSGDGAATHTLSDRKIIVTIKDDAATTADGGGTVTYYGDIKAPKTEGVYKFTTRTMTGPHGTMAEIGASPMVEVIGAHGKGTMALTRNGQPFTQTTSEAEVGNLVFTYTPGGRMAVGAMVRVLLRDAPGWSSFRTDNGDGIHDRGEVSLSGDKATLAVDALGTMFTATTTKVLMPSDRLMFTYKNVKVPKSDPASHTFVTQAVSRSGITLADTHEIAASPNVGIGRAADGTGSLASNVTQADAGSSIGDLVFTFTAAGTMSVGSVVEITIPDSGGWPAPSTDVSQPGGVTLGDTISASLATTATTMSATIATELSAGGTIVFTYKGITAPTTGGQYTFAGKSSSSAVGTLRPLQTGVTISIDEVAAGSIMLADATGMLTSAAPGMALGNLNFTFTAGAQMASGAQVQITIPAGWTPPFLDNNDGTDAAGEVSVAGAANLSVSGGGAQPWMLTATTTATLEIGNTLAISYKQVTAPAAEATYTFMTKSSVASGGTLLPITSQPNVIVRTPVAAIAVHAMPESVFAGDDVNITVDLWSAAGELAKALGSMDVMLDDGDASGSFSDADGNAVTSVTIADNMSSASATYMNGTAGMVTITATSGEMTATVDVEVKSTIRGLSVDNELVTQGATVMVSAIGQAGGGTVVVLDSDGDKVGTKKALDPVGEPDADGDQEYERSITLPAMLADGMYTVSVEIQGDVNNELMIEVVNDQTPPTVSDAEVSKMVVMNGDHFTLSANVGMNESMVAIASVTADVSMLDDTQADPVALTELTASPGTYTTIITVSDMNMAEDGEKTITITATDAVGNSTDAMVMVTLENDPSRLDSAEVTPASGKPGETIWIKAMGSAGDDASATVNNAETGMMIAQVTLDEDADNPGMYMAGLMIVEDAHPAGVYDVTVTLGTKMMTLDDALTIEPPGYDFTWSIGAGTHLIHVPLAVTQVNGMEMSIDTVRDLYNALGDAVNIIISLGADGSWNSYLGDDAPGMAFGDMMLGDSTGLVAIMKSAVTLELTGNALGTGGVSTIMLNAGNNLVGVPLDSTQISMISDVLGTAISAVVVSNAAGDGFQTITQAGDPGDGPLMGGKGYIAVAAAAASIPVIGSPWQNMGGASTAPPVASAANVKTPVLHVRGQLVDEAGMMTLDGLTVSVRNVTSGSVLGSGVATDEYSMTFVKLNSSAAKVGDILEIKADSGNPLLGIRPVQHVVTAEDVLNGSISLPDLVTYEIPAQSELLANYPNPFNPETWIPFRLAEDASVSLDIYGASGALVRTIDLGFTPAAIYEGRSDAIYWDGRNNFGEQVSSGLYFYHLRAGEFSATRRMVIVK